MLILVTAAAALWLATRPYQGIANDAQLYTLQALNALQHGHFDHDLYLRFGSQDQFTLFSAVYEPFLAAFGLSTGVLLATIAGQAVWLTGFILLLRTFTRSRRTTTSSVSVKAWSHRASSPRGCRWLVWRCCCAATG